MEKNDIIQLVVYLATVLLATPIVGTWMAHTLSGEKHFSMPILGSAERFFYRLAAINPVVEMRWTTYLAALLIFNGLGFFVLLGLQMFQSNLPLNPYRLPDVPWALAFNTAVSFMTNTNWQAYSGEATLGYLAQMLGLAVQNFLSAATGIAVFLALTRGLARRSGTTLGNFWVDVTRITLYVLLPLSIFWALVLVSQGVVQIFHPYVTAQTLEGQQQVIPLGPAASQIAIKQLGTNGGGFFGVNSTHPFENPTPLSNFLEMIAILLVPAALTYTYGKMIGNVRQGWCLFAAMLSLVIVGFATAWWAETQPNPTLGAGTVMEGKETRFGVMSSVLWSIATTAASNGSVSAMHDSMSPLAGTVQLFNIMLGEVVFGGAGAGLYGILMFVMLTVFIAGLMVGRTPEYLGKKVETREVLWAVAAVIIPSVVILAGTAISCLVPDALASRANPGPHGLSEILYAWSSAAGNNGSAFAGLNANTHFYNIGLGLGMLIGRFGVIIPALAVAGSMVSKKVSPPSPGTFPTDGATFVVLLIGVVIILGGLTFMPALTLGPIVEHFLMQAGRVF